MLSETKVGNSKSCKWLIFLKQNVLWLLININNVRLTKPLNLDEKCFADVNAKSIKRVKILKLH